MSSVPCDTMVICGGARVMFRIGVNPVTGMLHLTSYVINCGGIKGRYLL